MEDNPLKGHVAAAGKPENIRPMNSAELVQHIKCFAYDSGMRQKYGPNVLILSYFFELTGLLVGSLHLCYFLAEGDPYGFPFL